MFIIRGSTVLCHFFLSGMYTGEGVSSESGDSGEKGGGEREVCGLGFFETCQSSSDDDEGEKTKTKTPATPPVKVHIQWNLR